MLSTLPKRLTLLAGCLVAASSAMADDGIGQGRPGDPYNSQADGHRRSVDFFVQWRDLSWEVDQYNFGGGGAPGRGDNVNGTNREIGARLSDRPTEGIGWDFAGWLADTDLSFRGNHAGSDPFGFGGSASFSYTLPITGGRHSSGPALSLRPGGDASLGLSGMDGDGGSSTLIDLGIKPFIFIGGNFASGDVDFYWEAGPAWEVPIYRKLKYSDGDYIKLQPDTALQLIGSLSVYWGSVGLISRLTILGETALLLGISFRI